MAQGFYAYIQPMDHGAHPDQGGPGGFPGGGWNRPGHDLPGIPGAPGHPGHLPARPSRPTDPGYGVDEGAEAGQLPVWPLDPEHPDVGLPPVPGHPLPPFDPPPGTIWPPLPPEHQIPEGKAIVLVAISGVGYRYVVVDIPQGEIDNTLPGEGESPEHPEVQPPRPGVGPGRPGQGLPQPPRPPQPPQRPGQGLPGQRPPVAGQPLPRPPGRPQPK